MFQELLYEHPTSERERGREREREISIFIALKECNTILCPHTRKREEGREGEGRIHKLRQGFTYFSQEVHFL